MIHKGGVTRCIELSLAVAGTDGDHGAGSREAVMIQFI